MKTVQTVKLKCGNCDSKREEKNRAVAGGKGRISNFISRLGHLAGNQEAGFHSVCVCLFLTVGMRTSH